MPKTTFSTGLPALDRYIGGLQPGDSVLFIVSHPAQVDDVIFAAGNYARGAKIPLVSVRPSSGHSRISHILGEAVIEFSLKLQKNSLKAFHQAFRRVLGGKAKKSYVFMEELSVWKKELGKENRVVDAYEETSQFIRGKNSVLLAAALRSEFSQESLAALKDSSTLCFDIIEYQGERYCIPLQAQGRFISRGLLPMRFSFRNLAKDHTPPNQRDTVGPAAAASEKESSKLDSLLLAEHDRYRQIFDQAGEAMVQFDLAGDSREYNLRALDLLGYSAEEISTVHPFSLILANERFSAGRFMLELQKKHRASRIFTLLRKNGKSFPAEIFASQVHGTVFLAVLRDVSDRLKMERIRHQREEDYRRQFDELPFPVLVATREKVLLANPALLHECGYEGPSIPELSLKTLFPPDSLRSVNRMFRQEGVTARQHIEVQCLRKDGSPFDAELYSYPLIFQGKSAFQLVLINTSVQKNLLKTLGGSEKRHRALVEHSPMPAAYVREGKYVFANPAFLAALRSEDEAPLPGNDLTCIVAESERERVIELLTKRPPKGMQHHVLEFPARRGEKETFDARLLYIPLPDGSQKEALAFLEDVTAEKNRQREQAQRATEIELLREVIPSLQRSLDLEKIPHQALHRLMEAFGWTTGGFFLYNAESKNLELVHQKNLPPALHEKISTLSADEGIGGFLAKTQEPHYYAVERFPTHLPFRALFQKAEFKEICFLPLLARDELEGVVLLASAKGAAPVTFTKDLYAALGNNLGGVVANAHVVKKLREDETLQHRMIESADEVHYTAAPNGTMLFLSPQIEPLLGYSPKEFSRNPTLYLKLVHPEDKRVLLERTTQVDTIDKPYIREYRLLPKGKASYRTVRDYAVVNRDAQGTVSSLSGTLRDVTDEIDRVAKLAAEGVLQSTTLESIPEGIAVFDRDTVCLLWNASMGQLTGRTAEHALGKRASEILPAYSDEVTGRLLRRALDGDELSSHGVEHALERTPGEQKYIWMNFRSLRSEGGAIGGIVVTATDISERKHLESDMRESEQILRNVLDTMGDILVITDLSGKVLQVNRAFLHILGFSRTDAVDRNFPYPWLVEEEMGRYVLWVSELRDRTWLHDFDMTWKAKDGHVIPMSISTTLLRNSLGEPIAILNIARDITERTRLLRDLENRNQQIELINRISTKANQTLDVDEIFNAIASEISQLISADMISLGLLSNDGGSLEILALSGKHLYWKGKPIPIERTISQYAIQLNQPVIVPDLLSDTRYQSFASIEKGLRSQISLPISLKGKMFGTLSVGSNEPYAYTDEHAKILQPIAQQIGAFIDRVQLFKQVSEDWAYIHNLLDSIDNIVYTVDDELRLREVNKAWSVFMEEHGASLPVNFIDKNLFEVLPGERLKTMLQDVIPGLLDGRTRLFSEEYTDQIGGNERRYQVTINPMIIDQKITGLVFIHTDVTALKHSEEELKRGNAQLLALNQISTLINTSLDLRMMLESAIPLLQKTIGAGAVLVYLMERDGDDLNLAYHVGFNPLKYPSMAQLPRIGSLTGEVVSSRRPIYISERGYSDGRIGVPNREAMRDAGYEALVVIPVISKEKVLGALDIFYTSKHEFSDQERQVLAMVGNQLGVAIENAELYGELRSQIERMTVLFELSQQLTSTLNIDQIFQIAYEQVRQIIPYKSFKIDLYNESEKTKTPAFQVETIEGEQVFVSILAQPKAIDPGTPESEIIVTKRSYRSDDHQSLFVPMLSKGTIIGFMSLEGDAGAAYGESHLMILESIGNLSAIALEKGKLYEETLQKSLEIQRRNKELDDFTYVVSHDLKEPLISVEGFSRILQADYQEVIQSEGREYLDSIVGATARMKGLIDDLLLLSRVSRPSESFKNVDIYAIIDDIKTDMEFTIRKKGVTFTVPDQIPPVYANETQLKIVFRNLIGNAIKFNTKPSPSVEIGFQIAENNTYLFFVRDNGIGIDKDFHEKIFVIFQRLHRREEYEGTGAGLAIVKKIIELHKGRIWVESETGRGSTFFFTIPQPHTFE